VVVELCRLDGHTGLFIIHSEGAYVAEKQAFNARNRIAGRISRTRADVREAKSQPPISEGRTGHLVIGGIPAFFVRDTAGNYSVTLVTADRGHFGKAGYLYSDLPPVRRANDPYCNVEAPGDLWMLEGQAAPHWWIVSSDLQ
jgi:hypothetical protein